MTRSISTTSATSRPLPSPSPSKAAKAPEAPAEVNRGDRLDLGAPSREPLLEADLRLKVVAGTRLVANGQIGFSRTFLERLLAHALTNGETLSNAHVSFDPKARAYSVRATAEVWGMAVPFTVDLKPEVIAQGVGFKLDNLRIPLGDSGRFGIQHRWITGMVCEELAKELSYSLGAKAHPDEGVVTLDPNAILRYLDALPEKLSLNLAKTQLATSVSASGDLRLTMRGEGMQPAVDATPASDITVEANAAGFETLLKDLLAPDYEVGKVTLRKGGAVIDGLAEFKDGSDLVNAGKLLAALVGLAAGEPRAANLVSEPSRVMIPLDLDVSLDGTELRVTPSIGKALGELAKTLEAAGLSPIQEGKSLRADLGSLLKDRGAFESLDLRQDGMQIKMALDLERFILNPALTGPER